MASHDVIGDMLTKIRNASLAGHRNVAYRFSNEKQAISKILVEQGFLENVEVVGPQEKKELKAILKYDTLGTPVISGLKRISTPGRRVYSNSQEIPRYMNGLALTVVSTSKGILTGKDAKASNQGGEVICCVW